MKTLAGICFSFIAILINFSCTKEPAGLSLHSINQSNSRQGHYIGEPYGGGIIFYLDNKKQHGIIAATSDFEEAAPWSRKDAFNKAAATRIGAGATNTNNIFKRQGPSQSEADSYAAVECIQLIQNGYSDWYLPSKDELNQMYLQKDVIGNFKPFAYWSSSEINKITAWFQNFGSGTQTKAQKTSGYSIRAIRYF